MTLDELNQIKQNATLLYNKASIDEALQKMADKINQDYQDKNPVFLVVMNGGLVFAGKLLPLLKFPAQIDYCHATRYRGEKTGGDLIWKAKPQKNLRNRHVILIDDILDEGYTLHAIAEACQEWQVASVSSAVLIEKLHDRKVFTGMKPDYCELTTPDHYIFGCGMDVDHYWRNTESIYIYNPLEEK